MVALYHVYLMIVIRVVDNGRHVYEVHVSEITSCDYQGYWDKHNLFRHMPTLRKLKQKASCYSPNVWKKCKHKQLVPSDIPYELALNAFWVVYDMKDQVTVCHPLRPQDHNPSRRFLYRDADIIATFYNASYKAHNLKGTSWEIKISDDRSDMVEIVSGNREDIMADLTLLYLQADK